MVGDLASPADSPSANLQDWLVPIFFLNPARILPSAGFVQPYEAQMSGE
jgi:hypothetical protein